MIEKKRSNTHHTQGFRNTGRAKWAALMLLLSIPLLAGWKWYQWPTKEVVFFELGNPSQLGLGRWVAKKAGVTITYVEGESIQVLVTRPRVNTIVDEQQQQIDEVCRTFFTNIVPYWGGAYETVQQLWQHYELNKKALPVAFNQFTIKYTSNKLQQTIVLEPRKEFSFRSRMKEFSRRHPGG